MKAIILAAGRGSRLKEMTAERPKCLVEIDGQTLLDRQLKALYQAGISEIGIVRGYMADKISVDGATYFENPRWEDTQMVRSLMCAQDWLENYECVVCYSDIIYHPGTIQLLENIKEDIVIPYNVEWLKVWQARFEDPLSDAESFQIDEQGRLTEIGSKVSNIKDIQGQYMGILKFTPQGWREIAKLLAEMDNLKLDKMDMTSMLNLLIKKEIEIDTTAVKGNWFEIDSEQDIEAYRYWLHGEK